MADLKYDKVLQVDIGRAPDDFVSINNIVYFAEKVISPDGVLVDPLSMINGWNPAGVHQNHKYWELTLQLDTDYFPSNVDPEQYWAYYQNVDAADGLPAIVEDGANPDIEHMVVHVRQHDGSWEKFTYAEMIPRAGAYTSADLTDDAGAGRGTILADGGTPFAGLVVGDRIELKNCEDAVNDGVYTIFTVTDTLITLTGPLPLTNVADTTITIHLTNVLWCVGETAEFNNETGERHQPKTFKFICLRERVRADEVAAPTPVGAPQGIAKVKRISTVRTGGVDSENILGFKDDFIMKNTPQFVPNVYQGVGLKQDEKYHVLTVVVDSETDIFDSMMNIVAAQAPAGTDFLATFTQDDTTGVVETWTYEHAKTFMMGREEGRINEVSGRETIEYVFVSYGSRVVSQP